MNFEKSGVLGLDDISIPSNKRLQKGAVAIIECPQEIPCNPCIDACKFGAISMSSITALPKIDFDKCTGCGNCVNKCPGLAIFLIDMTYSQDKALIKIPYEFALPKEGEMVKGLDREGKERGEVKVIQVQRSTNHEKANVISVSVKKKLAMVIRNIALKSRINNE